jgi:hypothetical protein
VVVAIDYGHGLVLAGALTLTLSRQTGEGMIVLTFFRLVGKTMKVAAGEVGW